MVGRLLLCQDVLFTTLAVLFGVCDSHRFASESDQIATDKERLRASALM